MDQLRKTNPDCQMRRRLTQLYWAAVHEYNVFAAKRLQAVIQSGGYSGPETQVDLHERKEQAKNALLVHLWSHRCAGTD